jgi:hypothetical protein
MNFSTVNYGQNTGLKGDTDDFEKQSQKPLKYYTDSLIAPLKGDSGINFHEGFGISSKFIDTESQLIRSNITHPKIRQNYGMLPFATTGGLANSGPIISEDISRVKRACQPTDQEFYKRSFYDLKDHKNMVEDYSRSGFDSRQVGRSNANSRK